MSHQRLILLLAGLSAAAIIGAAVVIICLEPTQYDALGSLLGALASMIAVIWFSGSLYYQAVQLKEQREQFSLELKEQREQFAVQFRQLREDARRNALTLAKDILREAEDAALKANPSLQSINELTTAYLVPVSPLKTLMESTDPVEVRDSMADWLKIEAPPVSLMHGIKTAAEVYFSAIGRPDIDYSVDAATFVFIHGPTLWKLPYFAKYSAVATLLTEMMVRLEPGRKAATLAFMVAQMKLTPRFMKTDKIIEDVRAHRRAGLPVPAIAEDVK